jgi:hypothetical protein
LGDELGKAEWVWIPARKPHVQPSRDVNSSIAGVPQPGIQKAQKGCLEEGRRTGKQSIATELEDHLHPYI